MHFPTTIGPPFRNDVRFSLGSSSIAKGDAAVPSELPKRFDDKQNGKGIPRNAVDKSTWYIDCRDITQLGSTKYNISKLGK